MKLTYGNQTIEFWTNIKKQIDKCKSDITRMQSEQADWEELEKDLKAL